MIEIKNFSCYHSYQDSETVKAFVKFKEIMKYDRTIKAWFYNKLIAYHDGNKVFIDKNSIFAKLVIASKPNYSFTNRDALSKINIMPIWLFKDNENLIYGKKSRILNILIDRKFFPNDHINWLKAKMDKEEINRPNINEEYEMSYSKNNEETTVSVRLCLHSAETEHQDMPYNNKQGPYDNFFSNKE